MQFEAAGSPTNERVVTMQGKGETRDETAYEIPSTNMGDFMGHHCPRLLGRPHPPVGGKQDDWPEPADR